MRLSLFAAAATLALAALAVTTEAASIGKAKALRVMHERHEGMEVIGKANKALRGELEASAPDRATIRASAARIATLSRKIPRWFPKGTGPDVGKTEAKAGIWQKPEDFKAKAAGFARAARAFQAAARGGDLNAIRTAQGDLGKSCKACHDLYREDD